MRFERRFRKDLSGCWLSSHEVLRLGALCRWASRLNERLCLPATSGNFSLRSDDARSSAGCLKDTFLVTRSGAHKRSLTPADFVRVPVARDCVPLGSGTPKPSDEALLHDFIYSHCPDVQVVGHCHAPELEHVRFARPKEDQTVAAAVYHSLNAPVRAGWLRIQGHELLKAWGLKNHETPLTLAMVSNHQDMACLIQQLLRLQSHGDALWEGPARGCFLIENHGIYVCGESLNKAEMKLESLLHLLKMQQAGGHGLDVVSC